jgi:hypothetical protein
VAFEFSGEITYWRGPSPYHFVAVPEAESREIRAVAPIVSYGWGVIPVRVRIGGTTFDTSLFPKDGGYLVPVKDVVRAAEGITRGDIVAIELTIRSDRLGT